MNKSMLIAVDWGTSHLRAYLCQSDRMERAKLTLLDTKVGAGVSKVEHGFEHELFSLIQPWLDIYDDVKIVMSGQIGSSIGWQETEYLSCPVTPADVATKCLTFDVRAKSLAIIPGVTCKHDNGIRDVMRGEELQVLGWLQLSENHKTGEHLICLPGTHTKWVKVSDGKILVFKTALTGELFDLLSNQSVLIQEQSEEFDFTAFEEGVSFTLNSGNGSFSHGLFSVRSKQLFKELTPTQSQSYLSGVLIGSDVRAALNANEWELDSQSVVSIVGSSQLTKCFAMALKQAGIKSKLFDEKESSLSGFAVVNQILIEES